MRHEFDAALLADDRLAALAKRAAAHLDRESVGTAIPAEAAWRLAPPGGTGLVEVVIRDATGAVTAARLSGRDFDEHALRSRLIRAWGDALEARADRLARERIEADQAELAAP